jgi:hypothetical protein
MAGSHIEQLKLGKGRGKKNLWEVVAIPVILSFDRVIPVSQLDAVWQDAAASRFIVGVPAEWVLFPQLYEFDQLKEIAPDKLKQALLRLVSDVNQELAVNSMRASGTKRSTVFLRYLVGCRRIRAGRQDADLPGFCLRLQREIGQLFRQHLGPACIVESLEVGLFVEALYVGLWRYQMKRLVGLCQHAVTEWKRDVYAKVQTVGDDQLELRVGIFYGDRLIDGHDYLLRTRPGESQRRCLKRVREKIEESGVKSVIQKKRSKRLVVPI